MIDKKHYVIDFNQITYNSVISVQYELDFKIYLMKGIEEMHAKLYVKSIRAMLFLILKMNSSPADQSVVVIMESRN